MYQGWQGWGPAPAAPAMQQSPAMQQYMQQYAAVNPQMYWNQVQQQQIWQQQQQQPQLPQQMGTGTTSMTQAYPPLPPSDDGKSKTTGPAPPVPPSPAEEKPPLPPDPPPSDVNTAPKLEPTSSEEQAKMAQISAYAAHWKSQQEQWEQYQKNWYSYQFQQEAPPPPPPPAENQAPPQTVKPPEPVENAALKAVLKEEQEFHVQYKDWRKQYDDWKEQNKNHPNQEQYHQYEQQWKLYEKQMEEKLADIKRKKAAAGGGDDGKPLIEQNKTVQEQQNKQFTGYGMSSYGSSNKSQLFNQTVPTNTGNQSYGWSGNNSGFNQNSGQNLGGNDSSQSGMNYNRMDVSGAGRGGRGRGQGYGQWASSSQDFRQTSGSSTEFGDVAGERSGGFGGRSRGLSGSSGNADQSLSQEYRSKQEVDKNIDLSKHKPLGLHANFDDFKEETEDDLEGVPGIPDDEESDNRFMSRNAVGSGFFPNSRRGRGFGVSDNMPSSFNKMEGGRFDRGRGMNRSRIPSLFDNIGQNTMGQGIQQGLRNFDDDMSDVPGLPDDDEQGHDQGFRDRGRGNRFNSFNDMNDASDDGASGRNAGRGRGFGLLGQGNRFSSLMKDLPYDTESRISEGSGHGFGEHRSSHKDTDDIPGIPDEDYGLGRGREQSYSQRGMGRSFRDFDNIPGEHDDSEAYSMGGGYQQRFHQRGHEFSNPDETDDIPGLPDDSGRGQGCGFGQRGRGRGFGRNSETDIIPGLPDEPSDYYSGRGRGFGQRGRGRGYSGNIDTHDMPGLLDKPSDSNRGRGRGFGQHGRGRGFGGNVDDHDMPGLLDEPSDSNRGRGRGFAQRGRGRGFGGNIETDDIPGLPDEPSDSNRGRGRGFGQHGRGRGFGGNVDDHDMPGLPDEPSDSNRGRGRGFGQRGRGRGFGGSVETDDILGLPDEPSDSNRGRGRGFGQRGRGRGFGGNVETDDIPGLPDEPSDSNRGRGRGFGQRGRGRGFGGNVDDHEMPGLLDEPSDNNRGRGRGFGQRGRGRGFGGNVETDDIPGLPDEPSDSNRGRGRGFGQRGRGRGFGGNVDDHEMPGLLDEPSDNNRGRGRGFAQRGRGRGFGGNIETDDIPGLPDEPNDSNRGRGRGFGQCGRGSRLGSFDDVSGLSDEMTESEISGGRGGGFGLLGRGGRAGSFDGSDTGNVSGLVSDELNRRDMGMTRGRGFSQQQGRGRGFGSTADNMNVSSLHAGETEKQSMGGTRGRGFGQRGRGHAFGGFDDGDMLDAEEQISARGRGFGQRGRGRGFGRFDDTSDMPGLLDDQDAMMGRGRGRGFGQRGRGRGFGGFENTSDEQGFPENQDEFDFGRGRGRGFGQRGRGRGFGGFDDMSNDPRQFGNRAEFGFRGSRQDDENSNENQQFGFRQMRGAMQNRGRGRGNFAGFDSDRNLSMDEGNYEDNNRFRQPRGGWHGEAERMRGRGRGGRGQFGRPYVDYEGEDSFAGPPQRGGRGRGAFFGDRMSNRQMEESDTDLRLSEIEMQRKFQMEGGQSHLRDESSQDERDLDDFHGRGRGRFRGRGRGQFDQFPMNVSGCGRGNNRFTNNLVSYDEDEDEIMTGDSNWSENQMDDSDPYHANTDRQGPFGGGRFDAYRQDRSFNNPFMRTGFDEPIASIDYGHGKSDTASEATITQPEVFDYSHGKSADDKKDVFSHSLDRNRDHDRRNDRNRMLDRRLDIDSGRDRSPHSRDDRRGPRDRDFGRSSRDRRDQTSYKNRYDDHRSPMPPQIPAEPEVVNVNDILSHPGRATRPPQLVIILRGVPGSGKTYVSKLIRETEMKNGGTAPRILCLDDYFMVEVDKTVKDEESGRVIKQKVMEYEYEPILEESYRQSMLKSFKKTVDDGYFPFILVDAVNEKVIHFEEFWSFAKQKGFQVYTVEVQAEPSICAKRNTHNRSQEEIETILKNMEKMPPHHIKLDIRPLLQDAAITEVEMEEISEEPAESKVKNNEKDEADEEDDSDPASEVIQKKSKWELDTSEAKLDRLDGFNMKRKREDSPAGLEEFLKLSDYTSRTSTNEPGKKRVRWADIEEGKDQVRKREIGFMIGMGQSDWDKITDDDFAHKALNRTKFI
ncbi:uncharacterized protein LOC141898107 isoform X2 [Tubulanus polymorphus]|uniref:uncharacterized protein LOC141898107 isoform X2 n=1 Tax=Tubulanus polymorphus TaxID=672921 RepID=UPI003DA24326